MKNQLLEIWDDALGYCKTHPVIVCLVAAAFIIFLMGFWVGAS